METHEIKLDEISINELKKASDGIASLGQAIMVESDALFKIGQAVISDYKTGKIQGETAAALLATIKGRGVSMNDKFKGMIS